MTPCSGRNFPFCVLIHIYYNYCSIISAIFSEGACRLAILKTANQAPTFVSGHRKAVLVANKSGDEKRFDKLRTC